MLFDDTFLHNNNNAIVPLPVPMAKLNRETIVPTGTVSVLSYLDTFSLLSAHVACFWLLYGIWEILSGLSSKCTLFPFLRLECECSFAEITLGSIYFSLSADNFINISFGVVGVRLLMKQSNLPVEIGYVVFVAVSMLFLVTYPVYFFDWIPNGVAYGLHIIALCGSLFILTSRGGYRESWRNCLPIWAFYAGAIMTSGVFVAGQQILYTLSPALRGDLLPYASFLLAWLEFLWIKLVERYVNEDIDWVAVGLLARTMIAALEGLRGTLLLSTIIYSKSATEGPFLLTLIFSSIIEPLGRNKLFAHVAARLRGRRVATWGPFKRLVNGCKYDSNYTALTSILLFYFTEWTPYPLGAQCDGVSLKVFRPAPEFLVAAYVGEVVSDLLSAMLGRAIAGAGITALETHTLFCTPRSFAMLCVITLSCIGFAVTTLLGALSIMGRDLLLPSSSSQQHQ